MIVTLNGYDISHEIDIQGATTTDNSGGCADTCEIILPDTQRMEAWEIEHGMTLEITEGGYSTGEMKIDEIDRRPDGTLALRAKSLSEQAKEKKWGCFENVRLCDLLYAGARALSMDCAMYGVNETTMLRRVVQRNESWPEFLATVFRNECASIKFEGNRILAIGYEWAFARRPVRVIRDEGKGRMIRTPRLRTLRVRSGEIEALATDEGAVGTASRTIFGQQIYDMPQAIRAARGQLMAENVKSETYTLTLGEMDTEIAAMSRIDLYGVSGTIGNWFVSSVEHNFKKNRSTLRLNRCITTIR